MIASVKIIHGANDGIFQGIVGTPIIRVRASLGDASTSRTMPSPL